MKRILCWLGFHEWEHNQDAFSTVCDQGPVVIGWDQCIRCARSRLIHILR